MYLPDAGLYHYRARAYLPQLGRFLQPDPIGYGDGMNMYGYVGGDPVNWTDPWGLQAECIPGTRDADGADCVQPVEAKPPTFRDRAENFGQDLASWAGAFGRGRSAGPTEISIGGLILDSTLLDEVVVTGARVAAQIRQDGLTLQVNRGTYYDGGVPVWTELRSVELCNCFVADVLVQTEGGPVAIEDIEVDDRVLSRDDETGQTDYRPVVSLIDGAERSGPSGT